MATSFPLYSGFGESVCLRRGAFSARVQKSTLPSLRNRIKNEAKKSAIQKRIPTNELIIRENQFCLVVVVKVSLINQS
jgi:hypothetical protein